MAARTKKITTEEEIVPDEATEDRLDDDVIRALQELEGADDISWQVHRVSQPNPGYCEPPLATSELTLQRIAQEHGPGRYRIKGIKSDGKYFKSAKITIASPSRPVTSTALTVQPPSAQDNTLLIAMMNANTAIVTAALAKPTSEFPWAALLPVAPQMIKELRDYFKKENQDDLAMERVLKLVTVAEKLRGKDSDDKSSWADIIRDGLSGVSQMVAARSNGAPQSVPVNARVLPGTSAALPTVDGSTVPVETPEAVEPTIEMLGQQWMQQKIEQLITAAAANRNPELQGELFCDELPKYIPESLVLTMLSADNWFGQLCLIDARAQNYPQWFEEMRESILATLQPDGDAADAEEE